jgi:predicted transposase/invertase (TIGR01784 family)
LQIIETILIYKFPRMNREEIEAMFGLSELKQTRFYQEAKEEGELKAKLEAVPGLIGLGLTIEQIAQVLKLSVEEIRQNINIKEK